MSKIKHSPIQIIVIALLIVLAPVVSAEVPSRVASLNLCADQYLLAFARPEQISTLSPWARDPNMAFYLEEAKKFPQSNGSVEALIDAKVDMVIDGSYSSPLKLEMLRRQGLKVVTLSPWESLDEGKEEVRTISLLLGNQERGEALVREIDESLDKTKGIMRKPYKVLVIFRRGYIPAKTSTINLLLQHFGFELHQSHLGLDGGGFARLEALILDPPDYAIVDETTGTAMDNGSALLSHPALLRIIPKERRIIFPEKLFMCGGPTIPAAIKTLADEIRAKVVQ